MGGWEDGVGRCGQQERQSRTHNAQHTRTHAHTTYTHFREREGRTGRYRTHWTQGRWVGGVVVCVGCLCMLSLCLSVCVHVSLSLSLCVCVFVCVVLCVSMHVITWITSHFTGSCAWVTSQLSRQDTPLPVVPAPPSETSQGPCCTVHTLASSLTTTPVNPIETESPMTRL